MIQLAHVATGALVGRHRSGPFDALLAGLVMHGAMDVIPHGEVNDEAFEIVTAVGGVVALAVRHGLSSPIVWGAIGGVLPDAEHILPHKLRSSRGWFPTHRFSWTHGWETKPLALPAWTQAMLGGAIIGVFAMLVRRPAED